MNVAILVGRIGKDPEVKYTPKGVAVATTSLATTEKWGKGEDRQEKTEWHNLRAWGKLAEIFGEYIKKGMQVSVIGRIGTEKWTGQDGGERQRTVIVVSSMEMLGSKGGGQSTERPRTATQDTLDDFVAEFEQEDDVPL